MGSSKFGLQKQQDKQYTLHEGIKFRTQKNPKESSSRWLLMKEILRQYACIKPREWRNQLLLNRFPNLSHQQYVMHLNVTMSPNHGKPSMSGKCHFNTKWQMASLGRPRHIKSSLANVFLLGTDLLITLHVHCEISDPLRPKNQHLMWGKVIGLNKKKVMETRTTFNSSHPRFF